MPWSRRAPLVACAALGLFACSDAVPRAELDALRQPSGLALSPAGRWLYVTSGNWDQGRQDSALLSLDLRALEGGIDRPASAGAGLSADRPCRRIPDEERIECDPGQLIRSDLSLRIPPGAGNVVVDRPAGDGDLARLLIPSRIVPTVTWIDILGPDSDDPTLDCDQSEGRACDVSHLLSRVRGEPSRLRLDEQGFRFAYLPHLLGRRMTLIALDGPSGPEVQDVEEEFFREDPLFDTGLGGGFAVAQRACDLDTDNVARLSRDCTRPFLYATQRFWFGVREFRVAPGLDVLIPGSDRSLVGVDPSNADPRPLMGDLAFEDPERGDRLLVVQTTPAALSRFDTALDDAGDPRLELTDVVATCEESNLLAVHRPAEGSGLALVSCIGPGRVQAIDLQTFEVIANLRVGDGANELLVDSVREWAFVANVREDTLSVVELDRSSPAYLTEVATIGLGARRARP